MARKGERLSEETKHRMSAAKIGQKPSEATRQRISVAMTGHIPSEETRQKLSLAGKGRKQTEETKRKISAALKGRANPHEGHRHTEESKRRISEAKKGKPFGRACTEGTRRKLSLASKGNKYGVGRVVSAETRAKLSLALTGKKRDPFSDEWKHGLGNAFRGKRFSEEHCQKISVAQKSRRFSDEHRAALKESWAGLSSKERGERVAKSLRALKSPSSLEVAVCLVLDALGVNYEAQVPLGPYVVDILVSDKGLVIECDGEYWHSLPERIERDQRRDAYLMGLGYRVIRLPEKEIRQEPKQALLRRMELLCGYL